jgi:hypothetical protein
VSYLTDEIVKDKLDEKADIVEEWFLWIESLYADLLSRPSETNSESGFNPLPTTRPCEHRAAWYRRKLCLACDNTGWRRATKKEQDEGLACDPYSRNLPKSQVSFIESESSRRAQQASRLDSIISALDHHALIRDGDDIVESRELRQFRLAAQKPRAAKQVIACLHRVQGYGFQNFLDRREICLVIAMMVGRRLPWPPQSLRAL